MILESLLNNDFLNGASMAILDLYQVNSFSISRQAYSLLKPIRWGQIYLIKNFLAQKIVDANLDLFIIHFKSNFK